MPHKCARCNRIYEDNAPELMEGCVCGARVFLFLRRVEGRSEEEAINELQEHRLEEEDFNWLSKKIRDDLGRSDKTIHLDVENLLMVSKGRYRLNLASLMKGDPLVVKVRDGVYYIDIAYSMKKKR